MYSSSKTKYLRIYVIVLPYPLDNVIAGDNNIGCLLLIFIMTAAIILVDDKQQV